MSGKGGTPRAGSDDGNAMKCSAGVSHEWAVIGLIPVPARRETHYRNRVSPLSIDATPLDRDEDSSRSCAGAILSRPTRCVTKNYQVPLSADRRLSDLAFPIDFARGPL